MLKSSQNALDMSTDLRKNRHLLTPIVTVSRVREGETKRKFVPIVGHIQNQFLCSDSNLLEDLLPGVLADVVANHDTMGLSQISI